MAARKTNPKNLEKKLTQSYCDNVVDLADQSWQQIKEMIASKDVADKDKIRAMQLVFEAAKFVKSKETVFQFNQQINTGRESSNGKGTSFEGILRRLEARQDVIDVLPEPSGPVN